MLLGLKDLKKNGIEGLRDKPGRGRRPKLDKEKNQEFIQDLVEMQRTRSGGSFTGYDMIKLAMEKYGVQYSLNGIYDLVHRIGFSWTTGRSIHPKANPAEQEAFKKTL